MLGNREFHSYFLRCFQPSLVGVLEVTSPALLHTEADGKMETLPFFNGRLSLGRTDYRAFGKL